MRIRRANGSIDDVALLCRVDTGVEAEWLRAGGILPHALRTLIAEAEVAA